MSPVHAVAACFWSAVIVSAVSVSADTALRWNLRQHWKHIAMILLIAAIWRVPPNGKFFHGLEYEDSYVYTVAGRQIYERVGGTAWTDDTPLSVNVCKIGSLKSCREWEGFPEHLLGYPYVVAVAAHLFGYSSSVGSIINFIASLLAVVLVYTITLCLSNDPAAALFGGVAYAAIPVSAVYGLETSAEPFSALCVLLALHFFLNVLDAKERSAPKQAAHWGAYTTVLLLSGVTKREDLILVVLFPAVALVFWLAPQENRRISTRSLMLLVFSSFVAAVLISKIHLFQSSTHERALLAEFPLTASRLLSFVGSFLSSFLRVGWYAFSFVAVLIAAATACRRRDRTSIPILLLGCFVLVYAAHIRSYYEMESGHVDAQAALRFSMNLMGLWGIAVGLGWEVLQRGFKRAWGQLKLRGLPASAIGLAFVVCLVLLYLLTYRLRDYKTEDERISRVTPAREAYDLSSPAQGDRAMILTMDPLVIQMYSNTDAQVADLESLTTVDIKTLEGTGPLVFLKENARFQDADLSRYGEPIRYLLSLPAHHIASGEGYEVLRIDRTVLDSLPEAISSGRGRTNRYDSRPSRE